MPKIPIYDSKLRPTAESKSTTGGVLIDPKLNIAQATLPLTKTLTDLYVKEKKQEANNKALKILGELYIDQENGAKGLYSIGSETGSNPNPSEASLNFDNDIEKLWTYVQNNKLKDFDNFTKKALENKFYSTASLFKIKSLEESRNAQIKETRDVSDDFILKDALALKRNGIPYLDAYKKNVIDTVNKNYLKEDEGIKKQDIESYLKFGHTQLGNSLAVSNPVFLKENIDKLDSLNTEEKLKLIQAADAQILENKKLYFTSGLQLTEDSTADSIFEAYDEIKNATFGGDVNKIKAWSLLPENEKKEILNHAKTIRSQNTSEINNRNTATLNERKQSAINNYQKMFTDSNSMKTLTQLSINEIFGEPRNEYEFNSKAQIVELSTKIGQKEFQNINNYEKNFEIQKAILSGQITDHLTPFMLEGENTPKSITERVGDQISTNEFGYYINYLLPNINNEKFVKDHMKLYSVIESLQPFIKGESSLQYLDTTTDNRLNDFQSQMIFNFSKALKEGKNIDEILDVTSKNFLLKDLQKYKPNKDLITKIISEKSAESSDKDVISPPPWNPEVHKSYEDYINSEEYKEYLIKKQEQ